MRGADAFTESLFNMRHLDDFVPADCPERFGPMGAHVAGLLRSLNC